MRLWRNRHTRTFEGRVQQWVRVQVPLAAPNQIEPFTDEWKVQTVDKDVVSGHFFMKKPKGTKRRIRR